MKKLIFVAIFVAVSGMLSAQTQTAGDDLRQIDNAIKSLATDIAGKLTAEKAGTVTVGQFSYMGSGSQFNNYIYSQLTEDLAGVRGRSFTLTSGGSAEWIVSGEIVNIADVIRIYSRIVRRNGNVLVSQTHTDLELNRTISTMLSSGNNGGNYAALVMADEWESDGIDAPVQYDIQAGAGATAMNRTIQSGDEDWFVITPDAASQIVFETTGNIDTYMTLYNSRNEELASNDDGANGSNAQIRRFARAGESYIVKVRGYNTETAGDYGFRAYAEDLGEPTPYAVLNDINDARFVMGMLGGGGDIFLLVPEEDGTMVMETSGSNDVYMELYDAETYDMLTSDDDSGYDNNARIAYEVQEGRRYLAKVRGYSDSTTGEYGFKAYMQ